MRLFLPAILLATSEAARKRPRYTNDSTRHTKLSADDNNGPTKNKLFLEEDQMYWNYFLAESIDSVPSDPPSRMPVAVPSQAPSESITNSPSVADTANPTNVRTSSPSRGTTEAPFDIPTLYPTEVSTDSPSASPTNSQTTATPQTQTPTETPQTQTPTVSPSDIPEAANPTGSPSQTESPTDISTDFPSASPTNSQTQSPSTSPHPLPSEPPVATAAPTGSSQSPSISPDILPTEDPEATPTPTDSSQTPSSSPVVATSIPTDSPSDVESEHPSQSPSMPPTNTTSELPSSVPTNIASSPPSETPSESPTGSPTSTMSPTSAPTIQCLIEIDMDCVPQDGFGSDCSSIPAIVQVCEDQPFEMTFKYNGGDCSQSFNIQTPDLFSCTDFQDGPPIEVGTLSYIQAFALGGGEIYFQGFVPVGEMFSLTAERLIADNVNITVYDPIGLSDPNDFLGPENILQTVKFHSSCSRDLFLKDRFGSFQLAQFISDDQGFVTCFINATLELTVGNQTNVDGPVQLDTLFVTGNVHGFINRTDEVSGVVVSTGNGYVVEPIVVSLDLTVRQRYTFIAMVTGEVENGQARCTGNDFIEFVAGNPLPPIFPTQAPSSHPTTTIFPTPDPENVPCELETSIVCEVLDSISADCEDLFAPQSTQCDDPMGILSNLLFNYTGGNCNGLDQCTDQNGGPNNRSEVFIQVSDIDGGYFAGRTETNGLIEVSNPTGFSRGPLSIEIFEYNPENADPRGNMLQSLMLGTDCLGQDDLIPLVLGNRYGGVTLTSFTTDNLGEQRLYAEVHINYIISNMGLLPIVMRSAVVESFFSGFSQELDAPQFFERFESRTVFQESQVLDLSQASGNTYIFGLRTDGAAYTATEAECADSALLFFTVNGAGEEES